MPNSPNTVVTLPVTTVEVGPESSGGGGGRWLLRRDCACQMILQVPVQPFSGIVRVTCSNVRDVESHPPAHTHFTHSSSFIFIQLHLHSFPFKLTHTHSNSLILIQTSFLLLTHVHSHSLLFTKNVYHHCFTQARTYSVSQSRTHARIRALTHSPTQAVRAKLLWALFGVSCRDIFFKRIDSYSSNRCPSSLCESQPTTYGNYLVEW